MSPEPSLQAMNHQANRVKELLLKNANRENVQMSLEALSQSALSSVKTTSLLPLQHVNRVSEIRAKLNLRDQDLVKGFDNLLEALNTMSDEPVKIHVFESKGRVLEVFTNSSLTILLGVLTVEGKSITTY